MKIEKVAEYKWSEMLSLFPISLGKLVRWKMHWTNLKERISASANVCKFQAHESSSIKK